MTDTTYRGHALVPLLSEDGESSVKIVDIDNPNEPSIVVETEEIAVQLISDWLLAITEGNHSNVA